MQKRRDRGEADSARLRFFALVRPPGLASPASPHHKFCLFGQFEWADGEFDDRSGREKLRQ